MDNTFKSKEDYEKVLDLPVIGAIPEYDTESIRGNNHLHNNKTSRKSLKESLEEEKMFIVDKSPKSIPAESYRTLRTNIKYSSFDQRVKRILVTSSEPGEGKSITAGNIALSFSQEDKKVVIVDCDLRKPTVHKKFNISNQKGLSDAIINKETIGDTIKDYVYSYNENLDIIPAGKIPPNPSEMLSSRAMEELLKILDREYDYVILDSPPSSCSY